MIKTIMIKFVNPSLNIYHAISDMSDAIKNASYNLYSRYGVTILKPVIYTDDAVVVKLKIPQNDFSIGRHLRGISKYLLEKCDDRYSRYVVGTRLLTYTELPDKYLEDTDSIPDILKTFSKADCDYIFETIACVANRALTLDEAAYLINRKPDWTEKQKTAVISMIAVSSKGGI